MSENPAPKKILLFGGTGVIGKFILASLTEADPPFEKVGIFTSPNTLQSKAVQIEELKKKGVEIVVGDVNSEDDVAKAYRGKLSLV